MSGNGGREVRERVELLKLTGPHGGQQTFDSAFPLFAPRPEHDFAPLNRRAKGSLGSVVRGRDTGLVHERKEVLIVHEERVRQIANVGVGRVELPLPKGKEPFLNRQDFRDQFRAGERRAPSTGIAAEAMPEPKEAAIEREGLPAERFAAGVVARPGALNRLRVTCAQQNCRWPTTYFR